MKRVGILTFHKSINYGSVLQAFALSKLLESKGYDVEIIDYEPASYSSQYRIFEKAESIRNIAANIRRLSILDILWRQKRGFENFRNKHITISKKKFTAQNTASDLNNLYDVIICGSDQIWNVRAKDCDPIFFLPGLRGCKKIAYAASLNTASYNEVCCEEKLRKAILDFEYVSIREHSGAKKLEIFLKSDKEIKVQPDPTILQNKNTFEKVASGRIVKEPYIFMYCANYQESTIRAAQKMSEKLSKPVYTVLVCRSATQITQLKRAGIRIVRGRNRPEDFISFVMNADLILSDSFHGTAFSIIFEKNFFSINDAIDGRFVDDERICNILDEMEIKERYIKEDDVEKVDLTKAVNYSYITQKRMQLAEVAVSDLMKAIDA